VLGRQLLQHGATPIGQVDHQLAGPRPAPCHVTDRLALASPSSTARRTIWSQTGWLSHGSRSLRRTSAGAPYSTVIRPARRSTRPTRSRRTRP
jgi:hypothetical protein